MLIRATKRCRGSPTLALAVPDQKDPLLWLCSVRGRHTETAAYGAFSSLPRVPAKVLSAILCRPPSSCNANRWPVEFTAYALASRLRASWMEARVTKLAGVSARFSKSLARHRFRPNQEKARSTTPAARRDDEAPHVVVALDDLDAQQRHLCHRSFNLPRVIATIGQISDGGGDRCRAADFSWIYTERNAAVDWEFSAIAAAPAAIGNTDDQLLVFIANPPCLFHLASTAETRMPQRKLTNDTSVLR